MYFYTVNTNIKCLSTSIALPGFTLGTSIYKMFSNLVISGVFILFLFTTVEYFYQQMFSAHELAGN